MIDVKELEILNSTKCDCGHEFTLNDFTTLEQLQDAHGFYSNLVKHYCKTYCPECGKEIIMLLRQRGQTWEIMNTAIQKETESNIQNELITSTEETVEDLEGEKVENNNEETTTIENEEENNQTEEFICPECKKICKNKSGLTAHMRTHQN